MKAWICTIAGLLLAMSVRANFNPPISIEHGYETLYAGSYVATFGDNTCARSMTDILREWENGSFETTTRNRSNIGFTQLCYWKQFQIINESDKLLPIYIEITNPELERLEIYIFNDTLQRIKYLSTGNKYPFKQREVKHRNFITQLNAEPGVNYAVFIRVDKQANYVNVPIRVWEKSTWMNRDQRTSYRLGMFYGFMLLYIFIIGLMSYFLNDKYYLYYTLLMMLGIFFIFINEGLAFQYLWPRNPWLQYVMRFLILNAYLLFSMLLVENFIRNKLASSATINVLRTGIGFLVLLTLIILLYPTMGMTMQYYISIAISFVIIVVHIMLLILLYYTFKKTREIGLLLFIGAFAISFGIIIFFTLVKFGLMPVVIEGTRTIYIGGSVVAIIFTILFAYRVRKVISSNKFLRTELGLAGTKYSYALLEGQEKERKRVAEELHDGVGIKMSALKMKLSALHRDSGAPPEKALREVIENVDGSCADIRTLSHSLIPRNLDRYGLLVAINDLIAELNGTSSMRITFRQRVLAEEIEPTSRLALYRLVEGVLVELSRRKVEQVALKLVIIPSIQQASINFKYIGRRVEFGVNRNLENVRSIIQILNGQVRWTMDTMWSNQLDIDIPVVADLPHGNNKPPQ